jgi:TPP-dependent pyruvate/acetoin dehydrogenase alpha subunit
MPRKDIKIPHRIEYISVLNENGELGKALEPDISEEVLLRLYRTMNPARKFDERLRSLQRQGRIGTFPPISGQEAAHLGAAAALRFRDCFVAAFRETEGLISEGVLAIEMGALAEDMALSIHPHPTLSETEGEAAEIFLGSATHILNK